MKSLKKYELQNLIEQIERLDKMVKFHTTNPSKFMLNQYESEKEELLGKLIDRLVTVDSLSLFNFQLVFLAIKKYYPEVIKSPANKIDGHFKNNKNYKEFQELAVALA